MKVTVLNKQKKPVTQFKEHDFFTTSKGCIRQVRRVNGGSQFAIFDLEGNRIIGQSFPSAQSAVENYVRFNYDITKVIIREVIVDETGETLSKQDLEEVK